MPTIPAAFGALFAIRFHKIALQVTRDVFRSDTIEASSRIGFPLFNTQLVLVIRLTFIGAVLRLPPLEIHSAIRARMHYP